jgi:hypothetical protein
MSLSSDLTPFYLKSLPGMNNKGDSLEFGDKYVITAQNVQFDPEPGGVKKRPPIYYFNTATIASVAMTGLYRYYKSDGTTKFIGVCGTTVAVGDDTTETFTSIKTLTNTTKRCSFITYKDLLIGSNGYDDMFVYDGVATNVTWELGSCKVWTGSSAASMTATSISYQVTIDTDAFVCGAISNTLSVTGCNISLSNIPLGPEGTTNRKIYRKSSETGGNYRLIATIADNTTTTFTDNTAWAGSLGVIPAVTDDMPKGSELQTYRERMFVARDPNNPNRIYFSNPYLPHFIQQTTNLDYLDISLNDNDEITGIPTILGTMVCIKKNNIRKLYVGGPQQQWYAEDPFTHAGSPAPWSICPTPYGIVYLGWDHWYSYDGSNAVPIIDEFDTYDILDADYNDTITYFQENELLAAYTDRDTAQQYHNRLMRYNFKRKALAYDMLNINCFAAKRGDDETGELYYGSSITGYVYKTVKKDLQYKVITKSDCSSGTLTNVYVGGTESNPYIEIGNTITASSIPNNLVIFWDQDTTPGSGWTEITSYDDRYIRIAGSTASTLSVARIGTSIPLAAQLTTSSTAISYVYWRMFSKNATTKENDIPIGGILLWDQADLPDGYSWVEWNDYIKVHSTSYGSVGMDYIWTVSGTGSSSLLDTYVRGNFIKRTGTLGTWDGAARYAYCLSGSGTVSSNGWTNDTAYSGKFLITALSTPTETKGGDTSYGVDLMRVGFTQDFTASSWYTKHTGPNTAPTTESVGFTNNNSYDLNTNTYLGMGFSRSDENHPGGALTVSALFSYTANPINLEAVRYRITAYAKTNGHYAQHRRVCYFLSYCVGTTCTDVTLYDSTEGSGSATIDMDTGLTTHSLASAVVSVNAVKLTVCSLAEVAGGEGDCVAIGYARVHEVEVVASQHYRCVDFPISKKIMGKLSSYNGSWETNSVTAGTWTSTPVQIDADTMLKCWWNESLVGTDNALIYFRTGTTMGTCTGASWSTALTDPNGVSLSSITADSWCQFKAYLTATDTTVSNPRIYAADGYVVKYTYSKGASAAETAVEFIYRMGFRHFDQPAVDKIWKLISAYHEGTDGQYQIYWETENTTGSSFTIDLATNPERWKSFFPDNAMGKKIDIWVYKNDLYDFTLKEIQGFYTPEPLII